MKVLHVVPAVAPRYGGPSEVAVRLVAALGSMGAEALLATTDADGPGRLPVRTGSILAYEGAQAIFFSRLPGESLKASPSLACWVRAHAARFDLLHVHSVFSHPSWTAGRAAVRAGVPYILRPLGQLDGWSLAQHALRKHLFLAAFGRKLINGAGAIHWTDDSERLRAETSVGARPSFVLPLGVDESLFGGSEDAERERTVLFLSRLHPKKNVEALLEAFDRVGGSGAGWRLVIAGDGERAYVDALKQRAARMSGQVEFVGWLSGNEKRTALRRASLLVLPSRQENFGIVAAEAMAAGTPVLLSEAVALASEVEKTGAGWIAPLEPEGLARVLGRALSSPEERLRRGRAARAHASARYRWTSVAQGLCVEYERLSDRRCGVV